MNRQSLPKVTWLYWLTLFAASVAGTITGDLASHDLGLGYLGGLIPMALIFTAILFAEYRIRRAWPIFYWLAVFISRVAAANLADFFTHGIQVSFSRVSGIVAIMFAVIAGLRTWRGRAHEGSELSDVDAWYWFAILLASILGTALGDFFSEGLELGFGTSALGLVAVLLLTLFLKSKSRSNSELFYWIAVVILRTAGTTTGDFISSPEGLNLGLPIGALVAMVVFLGLALLPRELHGGF